jgi:glutamine amidotransferase/cyclase
MLDYGAGNVRSLVNAVEKLGYNITFVKDPSDLKKAEVRIRARACLLYGP